MGRQYIGNDPWIPRNRNLKPIFVEERLIHNYVASLMGEGGRWNVDLVRENFIDEEAEWVLKIPLLRQSREDEIIWHMDKRGLFNIKSAYHLGMNLDQANEGYSSTFEMHKISWKKL